MAARNIIRPVRNSPIIGAGKLQDMNNVEYNATIFEAISDEKGASDEVHWEYEVTVFNPVADSTIYTTVTWNNSRVDKWIGDFYSGNANLDCRLIVSLTGWCGPPYDGPIGALCLCAGSRCLVYQINVARRRTGEMPDSLASFLADQNIQFVGVGIEGLTAKLERDYRIGNNVRYSNLRGEAAVRYRQPDLATANLKQLAEIVLKTDYYLPPGVKASEDWDAVLLQSLQVLYGTFAAYLSYQIGWHLYLFEMAAPNLVR